MTQITSISPVNKNTILENVSPKEKEYPGYLPYTEFRQKFNLADITTEQLSSLTLELSQLFHANPEKGLELLLQADEQVIKGLEAFDPLIEVHAPQLKQAIDQGGRIFLVGSGSSGRVGLDLAAKLSQAYPQAEGKVFGIIAGGDSTIIRPKEGFEDSITSGEKGLAKWAIQPQDTVILISASGSASFNVGAGHYAANQGAHVYYFYNSHKVPARTQALFDRSNQPVTPLCIDVGPQAIAGSTRLQAASLAEVCLGSLITAAFNLPEDSKEYTNFSKELQINLKHVLNILRAHTKEIARLILEEYKIFSDPQANFRKVKDETDQGYVTFLAQANALREVLVDSTETPPTFCTRPPRREGEGLNRMAEYRAYLIGEDDNVKAWEALIGRSLSDEDLEDSQDFILSHATAGLCSLENRPQGAGNLTLGVLKLENGDSLSQEMLEQLSSVENQGGATGLITVSSENLNDEVKERIKNSVQTALILDQIPKDASGLSQTLLLKQLLNLISNGTMVLMNKVSGNLMVDMKASNNKLIDRAMRLIRKICHDFNLKSSLSDQELYHLVIEITEKSKAYEIQGYYVPSVAKMGVAMQILGQSIEHFDGVAQRLLQYEENLESLLKDVA